MGWALYREQEPLPNEQIRVFYPEGVFMSYLRYFLVIGLVLFASCGRSDKNGDANLQGQGDVDKILDTTSTGCVLLDKDVPRNPDDEVLACDKDKHEDKRVAKEI